MSASGGGGQSNKQTQCECLLGIHYYAKPGLLGIYNELPTHPIGITTTVWFRIKKR